MKKYLILILLFISFSANAKIKMAITIDDLPEHGQMPPGMTRTKIVEDFIAVLKKHKVPDATAFINGGRITTKEDSENSMKTWVAAGYSIGNHTFSHPSLNKNTADFFIKEIDDNEATLKGLNSKTEWKYFRYPYLQEGDTLEKRNAVRKHLQKKGYKIAQVTVDFEDWSWNNPYARCMTKKDNKKIAWLKKTYLESADAILDRADKLTQVVFKKSISHILLLHFGAFDASVFDQLLTNFEKKGVEFIPLSEAVKDDIYVHDPGLTFKNFGSEFQYQILKEKNQSVKDLGFAPLQNYLEEVEKVCL